MLSSDEWESQSSNQDRTEGTKIVNENIYKKVFPSTQDVEANTVTIANVHQSRNTNISNLKTVPDHFLLLGIPSIDLGIVDIFNRVSFDFLGRCQKAIFGQPIVLNDNQKLDTFMPV